MTSTNYYCSPPIHWDLGSPEGTPKGVWLVVNPHARNQGIGLYTSWPSAKAASNGISSAGATWYPSPEAALPAWHARCQLGVHTHPADPNTAPKNEPDVFMSSPAHAPPSSGSAHPVHPAQESRVAFAKVYMQLPGHDPNASCLLVEGRPSISAAGHHYPGFPAIDFRTPQANTAGLAVSVFEPSTPTKTAMSSSPAAVPLTSSLPLASSPAAAPSSPIAAPFPPMPQLFFAVQGGESLPRVVGHGNLCTTTNLDKATLVAAGHDVEQAEVIMAAWAVEEREAARLETEAVQQEEAKNRAEASARRRADIAAGVAERKVKEERGRLARRQAILQASAEAATRVGEGSGKGKGRKRSVSCNSDSYDEGFYDLTSLNLDEVEELQSSPRNHCQSSQHRAAYQPPPY
ncbi:hypothetical protein B0H11DRAFT_2225812 [Mycena galericulata]|nr:hypothetical protein B0H11DRAFT_2225812 [Mycena galericulata]